MHPDKALYVFISSIRELSDPTPRHAPSIETVRFRLVKPKLCQIGVEFEV